jgi:hypothetical protein
MTEFAQQTSSVISKQTIGSLSRRMKDGTDTNSLSSGEQTVVFGSNKQLEKKSKTNNLTHQLQTMNLE